MGWNDREGAAVENLLGFVEGESDGGMTGGGESKEGLLLTTGLELKEGASTPPSNPAEGTVVGI